MKRRISDVDIRSDKMAGVKSQSYAFVLPENRVDVESIQNHIVVFPTSIYRFLDEDNLVRTLYCSSCGVLRPVVL